MSYKYIDSRQIKNVAALPNIGAPANDSLDAILALIDSAISGSGATGYVAKKMSLTNGSTSQAVTISSQPDTSYIVMGLMVNIVDSHPQFQQVEITSKSTTGFTFSWNHPLDSANYFISFIIPYKTYPEAEASIGSGVNTLTSNLFMPQSGSSYPVIAELQNIVDAHPQFQTVVIGSNSTNSINLSFNVPTDTANYMATYTIGASGQAAIGSGVTSVTVPLPINYNTSNYAVIASIQDTTDPYPQFQPLLVTAQGDLSVTFSWSIPTDTANYTINYYAISLTP